MLRLGSKGLPLLALVTGHLARGKTFGVSLLGLLILQFEVLELLKAMRNHLCLAKSLMFANTCFVGISSLGADWGDGIAEESAGTSLVTSDLIARRAFTSETAKTRGTRTGALR